ncbi:MAG TPA: hypothetical protein PKA17_09255, partial [Phenylobacterium sp.]|nr:hypothetical protein [Phenylobacterium sp.]
MKAALGRRHLINLDMAVIRSMGPVALATARLHALRGDTRHALADVAVARQIAERSAGVPTL